MNFSDIEIEILFCKYDIDGNGDALDMDEVEDIMDDIDDGKFNDPTFMGGSGPAIEQGASSQGVMVGMEDIEA